MTDACLWRLRWLIGVEFDVARLRDALRAGGPGDARRVRGMLAELGRARALLRSAATLGADVQAVSELIETVGPEATSLALRLRGRPWREIQAAAPGRTEAAVREGWDRLCQALSSTKPRPAPAPTPGAQAPQRAPQVPASAALSPERWIGRARDGERSLRLLDVFRRVGLIPPGTRAEIIFRHARRLTASCYLLVHLLPPAASAWALLQRCGLRLLAPAPAGV